MKKRVRECECADPNCPVHPGLSLCQGRGLKGNTLYRIDMDDCSGTIFCDACAIDAMTSGLFQPRHTGEVRS